MSKTIIDMPKVAQMLDSGWMVTLHKNRLGDYIANGVHKSKSVWRRARNRLFEQYILSGFERLRASELVDAIFDDECSVTADDFTPEQALTRLAYKIHGEIIDG